VTLDPPAADVAAAEAVVVGADAAAEE
jgi:hypothetical protein